MTCVARQYSDQMVCSCGLAWDMNDPSPPTEAEHVARMASPVRVPIASPEPLLARLVRAVDGEASARKAKAKAYSEYKAGRLGKFAMVETFTAHKTATATLRQVMRLSR